MADPMQLPEGVADLLDRTLGEGGEPGVLADWLDENSRAWEPFAAALRAGTPPPAKLTTFSDFRYQEVCGGVMFWVCKGYVQEARGHSVTSLLLVGVSRAVPLVPGEWRLAVPPTALPKATRARLWKAFGVSEPADAE